MDKKKRNGQGSGDFIASLGAIVVGLLFGLLILFISNPSQALGGFKTILMGGFSGGLKGVGQVFYFATPIILTGLSVGFAFKTGLFNIGASGQFIIGACAAVYVGANWTFLPGSIHWIVALLAAFVAGGLWALLPGVLKAKSNVNEVISTIMMNYIGMYLVNLVVKTQMYDKTRNQSMPVDPDAVIPKMGMDKLFPNSSVNGGILIAILMVVLVYILMEKTTVGFELKACGLNRDASKYSGINETKNIILSMVIAGALAGLGGGLLYLAGSGKFIEVKDVIAPEGFNGIPVALLGLSNPIGILFAGLFISYITVGGFYMQLYDFVPEIIDIIIAIIIYFSAFAMIFKSLLGKAKKSQQKKSSGGDK